MQRGLTTNRETAGGSEGDAAVSTLGETAREKWKWEPGIEFWSKEVSAEDNIHA